MSNENETQIPVAPAAAPEPPKANPELVSYTTRSEKPGTTLALRGITKTNT